MIVDSDVRRFESNATVQTNAFQIAASPKAFSILSSQLYSNKPRAIVRELSANASDGHTAAGNKEPFIIEFPSSLNPSFRIRDFGTGLSDEGIKTLYTTYFGSNKTGSNEQIGGLGLGSKSPFAYTDQFNVTSFFNGTKSMYQAYIGEDSVPQIALLAAEVTLEPNGIEVVIPIKPQDIHDFVREADVLRYFKPLPTTTVTIPVPNYDHVFDIDDVKVCMRNDDQQQTMLVQGPIPYPITAAQNLSAYPNWRIFCAPIDIIVPVGFCEIAASREGLSYNKATIARLTALGDKIIEALRMKIQSAVADATDLADAYKTLQATSKLLQSVTSVTNTQTIVWKGHSLTVGQHFPISLPINVVARVIHRNDSWGSKRPFVSSISENHVMLSANQHSTQFFHREKGGAFYSYFEELRANADANINHARYIILEGPKAQVDKLIADYHLLSTEFPKLKPAVGTGRTAKNLGKTQYHFYHYAAGEATKASSRSRTANDILQLDPSVPIYANVDVARHEYLRTLMAIKPPITLVSVQDSHTKVLEAFKETQLDTEYNDYMTSFITRSLVEKAYTAAQLFEANASYSREMSGLLSKNALPHERVRDQLAQIATAAGLGPVALELIQNLKQHTRAPSLAAAITANGTMTDIDNNSRLQALAALSHLDTLEPMFEAIKKAAVTYKETDSALAVASLDILRSHFPMVFSGYFISHLNNNSPARYYHNKNQPGIDSDVAKFIKDYILWANAKRTDPATDVPASQPDTTNEEYGYAA